MLFPQVFSLHLLLVYITSTFSIMLEENARESYVYLKTTM